LLSLTRQALPALRTEYVEENRSSKGGYILAESEGELQVTIFATGSEVHLAVQAREKLQANGIGVRVVSMVCTTLFDQQPAEYIHNILCNDSVKVAVEAACKFGWERYIGAHGIFVGMEGFGASAKAEDLYQYFEITVDKICNRVMEKIEGK
jgi:transketolase